jgi:predicted nucleotidyltransferase
MKKEQEIITITHIIDQVIPYKKEIIFFGSRAGDNYKEDSDFDILIIINHKNIDRKKMITLQAQIKRLCAKSGLDTDIIVRDRSYADELKDLPGNIIHSALQTGIRLQ